MNAEPVRWQRAKLVRDPRNLGREGWTFWVKAQPPQDEPVLVEREDGVECGRVERDQLTTNLRYENGGEIVVPAWAVELLPEFAVDVEPEVVARPADVEAVR